jgi:hypothetical protein
MLVLVEGRVKLIEQPFKIGQEAHLDVLSSPIPLAADESVQRLADLPGLVGRFNEVNIKLDKCGGLTEAMARETRRLRLEVTAMRPRRREGDLLGFLSAMQSKPLQTSSSTGDLRCSS